MANASVKTVAVRAAKRSEVRNLSERWAGLPCYLDGKPAKVTGRLQPFATVATLDGSQSVEFSWQAVNRIMYGKMEFRS